MLVCLKSAYSFVMKLLLHSFFNYDLEGVCFLPLSHHVQVILSSALPLSCWAPFCPRAFALLFPFPGMLLPLSAPGSFPHVLLVFAQLSFLSDDFCLSALLKIAAPLLWQTLFSP